MEKDETKEMPVVEEVVGKQVVQIHPTSLYMGVYDLEDSRALFVFTVASLGPVLPLWERKEDMVAMFRVIYPGRPVGPLRLSPVMDGHRLIELTRRDGLTIVVNPRIVGDGDLQYGKLVWN